MTIVSNLVVVRKYIGYERYDCIEAVEAMNELYEVLRLYLNFFQPTFKLQGKEKRVKLADGKHSRQAVQTDLRPAPNSLQADINS